jgi:hypothetical protein
MFDLSLTRTCQSSAVDNSPQARAVRARLVNMPSGEATSTTSGPGHSEPREGEYRQVTGSPVVAPEWLH